jgi:hypothetical protein
MTSIGNNWLPDGIHSPPSPARELDSIYQVGFLHCPFRRCEHSADNSFKSSAPPSGVMTSLERRCAYWKKESHGKTFSRPEETAVRNLGENRMHETKRLSWSSPAPELGISHGRSLKRRKRPNHRIDGECDPVRNRMDGKEAEMLCGVARLRDYQASGVGRRLWFRTKRRGGVLRGKRVQFGMRKTTSRVQALENGQRCHVQNKEAA